MKKNIRKIILSIIVIFIFGLVFSSVSFSYKNNILDIKGNTKVYKNSWNVYFDNLKVSYGDENNTINLSNTDIDLVVSIDKRDYLEFTFDVINDSLYDLKLNNINILGLNDQLSNYLDISYMYMDGNKVSINDSILSGESKEIKLLIENISDNRLDDLQFLIKFLYIQN